MTVRFAYGFAVASAASDKGLRKLLLSVYENSDTIERIVRNAGLPVGNIVWGLAAVDLWPQVLELAAKHRATRELLQAVVDDTPALVEPLRLYLVDNSTAEETEDPYEIAMVGPRPFIGRGSLRRYVREMTKLDGSRVLVVSGAEGSGKSHTWFFVSDLAERTGMFDARVIDLSRRAGGPASLDEVIDTIAFSLVGEPAPRFDATAQDETIIRHFVAWLTAKSGSFDRPVWLVFDGFVTDCATPAAQYLVTAIAIAADRRALQRTTVSVLGFSGRSGEDILAYALRDQLDNPPADEDLKCFFRGYAARRGRAVDDDGLLVLLDAVLLGDLLNSLSMAELSRRAREVARKSFDG